ncbi:MAG: primosomal protein N', partial [Gammaproteobacteria bacterium]
MKDLGLIIIDEEHDPSFKQQQGWMYSARDLALVRARDQDIPIILGTATASLETLHKALNGKCHHLKLRERPGDGTLAKYQVLDIRKLPMEQGLSRPLMQSISKHLNEGNQVLIFLNRRGFAPVLMCHDCGWMANCKRCETSYTLHQSPRYLHCHHCDGRRQAPTVCPDCQSENVTAVGVGTERLESLLSERFPDFPLARIDRDSTRRKGAMQNYIDGINNGHYKILIGTQMLSKGHHFPDVSLVAIIDMDGALFSSDFRAAEKFGQLLTQVAGRAGRAEKQGTVMLQTHHPDHPQLQALLDEGYIQFAHQLLKERQQCLWPPYSLLAMFRAEATSIDSPEIFLNYVADLARQYIDPQSPISILGPVPAPMGRRAGKYRNQLLLQGTSRKSLQKILRQIIFHLESNKREKIAKSVRWSLDVDPLEMF